LTPSNSSLSSSEMIAGNILRASRIFPAAMLLRQPKMRRSTRRPTRLPISLRKCVRPARQSLSLGLHHDFEKTPNGEAAWRYACSRASGPSIVLQHRSQDRRCGRRVNCRRLLKLSNGPSVTTERITARRRQRTGPFMFEFSRDRLRRPRRTICCHVSRSFRMRRFRQFPGGGAACCGSGSRGAAGGDGARWRTYPATIARRSHSRRPAEARIAR